MPFVSNRSLRTHQGRPVSAAGLQTALILSFVTACAFWVLFLTSAAAKHDGRNHAGEPAEPLWAFLLAIAFVLIPYIASFALVSTRKQESMAAGAGVAAGFFGIIVLVSPFALLVMLMFVGMSSWNGPPDPGLIKAAGALLAFLGISLWIVWSAFRIGRIRWNVFVIAACATGLYAYLGYHQVIFATVIGQQQAQKQKWQADLKLYMPADLARRRLLSLTACLLRNHMQHPEAGYPASLESPPSGWACDTRFEKSPIKEFTFSYTPQNDVSSGVVTDFRLEAIPNAKGVNNRNPIMTDSRGIVFVYYPWEIENAHAKVMASGERGDSQIDQLKLNIEAYAKAKNGGIAPAKLDAESIGGLGHEMPTITDDGMHLVTRDFEAIYVPPTPAQQGFELSVQCKSYAQNCMRSFFLGTDGVVHATGEPRQATANDPLSLPCEQFFGVCPDVDWSVP